MMAKFRLFIGIALLSISIIFTGACTQQPAPAAVNTRGTDNYAGIDICMDRFDR